MMLFLRRKQDTHHVPNQQEEEAEALRTRQGRTGSQSFRLRKQLPNSHHIQTWASPDKLPTKDGKQEREPALERQNGTQGSIRDQPDLSRSPDSDGAEGNWGRPPGRDEKGPPLQHWEHPGVRRRKAKPGDLEGWQKGVTDLSSQRSFRLRENWKVKTD